MPGALSMPRLLFYEESNLRPYESSISCLEKKKLHFKSKSAHNEKSLRFWQVILDFCLNEQFA